MQLRKTTALAQCPGILTCGPALLRLTGTHASDTEEKEKGREGEPRAHLPRQLSGAQLGHSDNTVSTEETARAKPRGIPTASFL